MLVASASDPIPNMHLIHTLCRLAVAHHFQNEIEKQLAHHFVTLSEIIDYNKDYDLHTIAVVFQVFRFHGYNMSSATQSRIKGEVILDEALAFTKSELQSIASLPIDPYLTEYVVYALLRIRRKLNMRKERRHSQGFY
ncbi:hypothetical protein V6N12_000652 [Hibiscus sabdariffa]|uniref:Terpene synthase N-terminal domain-containing protein n=1 Tax=Hibiscus sabdariffa TaxID=183260 RepID=A0ABR2AKD2_9ROSI